MDIEAFELPDYSGRKERPEGRRCFGGVEPQTYPKNKKEGKHV